MSVKIGKKQYRIEWVDLCMFLICLVTIAFHNYKKLVILGQVPCSFFVCFGCLRCQHFKISKSIFAYLIRGIMFTFYCVLSGIWSINSSSEKSIMISVIQVLVIGITVLIYLKDSERYAKFIRFLLVSALILCGRIVIHAPLNALGTERIGQYVGYGNVGVSNALAFITIFIIDWAVTNRRRLVLCMGIFLVFASFLTGSKKTILVCILAYSLLFVFKSKNSVQVVRNIFISCMVVGLLVLAIFKIPVFYHTVGYRLERMIQYLMGTGKNASTEVRWELKLLAWEQFKKYPILGGGLDSFTHLNVHKRYAHDNYLDTLANLGIVGFILYYAMLLQAFWRSVKTVLLKNKKEYSVALVFLIVFFVCETMNMSYVSEYLQITLALCFALIWNKNVTVKLQHSGKESEQ